MLTEGVNLMFKSGWIRLWLVLTGILLIGVIIFSSYYIWGRDYCYNFVSVSVADKITPQDRELVDRVIQEATTSMFCGKYLNSTILTLENLAQRGVVTQVAFQWLEPSGWSYSEHAVAGISDNIEIKAPEILSRVSTSVYHTRFFYVIRYIIAVLSISPFALALGFGISWVRKGFAS